MVSFRRLLFCLFHLRVLEGSIPYEKKGEEKITSQNISLYFYTRFNSYNPQKLNVDDLSDLENSNFDRLRLNYFVIHGIFSNYKSMALIKDPLLNRLDSNVFLVDYSGPGSKIEIHDATILSAGKILANFINLMRKAYDLMAEQFVLVGFSMGAHIAGEIGRNLNGDVGVIVALDPANMTPPIVYVDKDKAHFVQSIHTSNIGLKTPVGHANYFPNTPNQPGCHNSPFCSHHRAPVLYAESLTGDGLFVSVKCDSYDSFIQGLCKGNEKSYLGGIVVDESASGSYYLETNSKRPYSIN